MSQQEISHECPAAWPAALQERLAVQRARLLWCVHVLGPDELHAARDHEHAAAMAEEMNRHCAEAFGADDILLLAIVSPWPGCATSHALSLEREARLMNATTPPAGGASDAR